MKVLIVPGNDHTLITNNWYPYVKERLENLGVEVIAENMPDPKVARKGIWLPYIKEQLGDSGNSTLIGHSTGAIAVLRYLEKNKCRFVILVSCYHTNLGDELEKQGGYFDEPWKWDKIKNNAEKIVIFASTDDPFVPISEPRFVKEKLEAEYHEYKDEGHFGLDKKKEFPEIVTIVEKMLKAPKFKL